MSQIAGRNVSETAANELTAGELATVQTLAGLAVTNENFVRMNGTGLSVVNAPILADIGVLTDPGADRLLFWDDSEGAAGWLTLGSGLSLSGTTLTVTASGAPSDSSYVVMGVDATLTDERALLGTANQITVSDGGAGGNVTLSTPQNIATTSSVQFANVTVNSLLAASNDVGALGASGTAFSDLFLASGAVINFFEGDVLITHSANTLTFSGGTVALGTATATGGLTGDVTGNVSGTAATVTGAAQANITSLGTLTTLTVDDITINGNTISSAGASSLAITPTAGQAILLDGTISVDAGVVTGATSITSTTFVGALTGTASGNLTSGGALGTPSSGTLTNCTGLPVAGITASTSTALGVGSIELGHASDTTLSRSAAGVLQVEGVSVLTVAGGTLTGNITLGEGADPATIGIVMDASMSADERYSGITVPGTAGATLAFGDICYLDVTAAEWLLADADAASTAGSVVLGICVDASTDGAATSMLLLGTVRSAAFPASIALGAPVYISTTAGDITATAPTGADDVVRVVGHAVTVEPNTIYFNPSPDHITVTG